MYIQFFEDQYKILEKFPSDVRWKTLDAIMLYVFKGTEPKLDDDPIVYAIFEWMRFSLDKSIHIAKTAIENWKKWWAPKGNSNAVKSFENILKQPENNPKQPRTKNYEQWTKNDEQRTKKRNK